MELKILGSQLARFASVGLTSAVLDFAILQGLIALGADPYLSRLASVIPVITTTWLFNRQFTFSAQAAPSWGEYFRYIGISATGLAVNYGIYWLGLYWSLPVWLAFVIGTGAGSAFNFLRYRILLK